MKDILDLVRQEIKELKDNKTYGLLYSKGHSLFLNGQSLLLSRSSNLFEFSIFDEFNDYIVSIDLRDGISLDCSCKSKMICHHKIAALMQSYQEIGRQKNKPEKPGLQYTCEGMEKRVLQERRDKAEKAEYKIEFSENIYGEHFLTNERNQRYKITLRNFEKQQGYCSCPDFQTNKLGTCKHLMFVFEAIKKNPELIENKSKEYPFVEIYLDPTSNYQVAWYFPGRIGNTKISTLLFSNFGKSMTLPDENIVTFLGFLKKAEKIKQILIRPEVYTKVEKIYAKDMLKQISKSEKLDFSKINTTLYPYQKKGVEFATFKEGAIIADEMGLGKTIQAISTAVLKKELFGFTRCLIICPESQKVQWKNEIEKFTSEKVIIISGSQNQRQAEYQNRKNYFQIANYELVVRDKNLINQTPPDFIILDEAQRIKNYQTITAKAIKQLIKKHSLVITDTPIETRPTDLYSIVGFIDPLFLSPLWEFSYRHYYFDAEMKNKIMGYFDLGKLKSRLSEILIRREKIQVQDDLPNISKVDVPILMNQVQQTQHTSFAVGIAKILNKKFKTAYDWQKLLQQISKMRMVCNSTFLVDNKTNISPKLKELQHILFDKLNIKVSNKKIIVFSEWKRMNSIIGKMLRDNGIDYTELNDSIAKKSRIGRIEKFEQNSKLKILLCNNKTDLEINAKNADTIINFGLPLNPENHIRDIKLICESKLKTKKTTIINLITQNSIEEKIAAGLAIKQKLFDADENTEIEIDENEKAIFLYELNQTVEDFIYFDKQHQEQEENIPIEEKLQINEIVGEEEIEEKESVQQKVNESETKPHNENHEPKTSATSSQENIEQVLKQGMGFLNGIFKMATGSDLLSKEQSVSINKETGEVILKFKIPQK